MGRPGKFCSDFGNDAFLITHHVRVRKPDDPDTVRFNEASALLVMLDGSRVAVAIYLHGQ